MRTLEALKKLALKVCSSASQTELDKLSKVDEVIDYIATNFDGGAAAAANEQETLDVPTL